MLPIEQTVRQWATGDERFAGAFGKPGHAPDLTGYGSVVKIMVLRIGPVFTDNTVPGTAGASIKSPQRIRTTKPIPFRMTRK